MVIQVNLIPVMIASPGDVAEERDIARRVVQEWNDLNALHEKLVLLARGWETAATPDLSKRPQQLINERVLADCDLLIGIFWTRLGTPTGEHESGTVEEIKQHVNDGKATMIYFSSRPASPQTIDPKQYERLQDFRSWCQRKGLLGVFEAPSEFEKKLTADLVRVLRENEYISTSVVRGVDAASLATSTQRKVTLSAVASDFLHKAATSNGLIQVADYLGGTVIQIGNESLGRDLDRREIARYKGAIEELEAYGLVNALGWKRDLFELTNKGYEIHERSFNEDQGAR